MSFCRKRCGVWKVNVLHPFGAEWIEFPSWMLGSIKTLFEAGRELFACGACYSALSFSVVFSELENGVSWHLGTQQLHYSFLLPKILNFTQRECTFIFTALTHPSKLRVWSLKLGGIHIWRWRGLCLDFQQVCVSVYWERVVDPGKPVEVSVARK